MYHLLSDIIAASVRYDDIYLSCALLVCPWENGKRFLKMLNLDVMIGILGFSYEITLPLNRTGAKLTLVQVMTGCQTYVTI